jgi:hypothetical protein
MGEIGHHNGMPKRSSSPDFAQDTLRAVEISTGEPLKPKEKDAAAVSLGRRGGLKGGNARAAKLTSERLSEIAQQAAKARWAKAKGVELDARGS